MQSFIRNGASFTKVTEYRLTANECRFLGINNDSGKIILRITTSAKGVRRHIIKRIYGIDSIIN